MKYQIRKCVTYTIIEGSEVVDLDPKDFKNLEDNPYTGETEQDFVNYISEFISTCQYDGFPSDLKDSVADELEKLGENIKYTEYSNSAHKGEDSWFELGKVDESYRRTGGFDSRFDTAPDNSCNW
jgi:hypothetical protein